MSESSSDLPNTYTDLSLAEWRRALAEQWTDIAVRARGIAAAYRQGQATPLELAAAMTSIICARGLTRRGPRRPTVRGREVYKLTDRQREVLTLIAEGRTHCQIARQLDLEPETIKTHVQRLYRVLGALNGPHAVLLATRAGILV